MIDCVVNKGRGRTSSFIQRATRGGTFLYKTRSPSPPWPARAICMENEGKHSAADDAVPSSGDETQQNLLGGFSNFIKRTSSVVSDGVQAALVVPAHAVTVGVANLTVKAVAEVSGSAMKREREEEQQLEAATKLQSAARAKQANEIAKRMREQKAAEEAAKKKWFPIPTVVSAAAPVPAVSDEGADGTEHIEQPKTSDEAASGLGHTALILAVLALVCGLGVAYPEAARAWTTKLVGSFARVIADAKSKLKP